MPAQHGVHHSAQTAEIKRSLKQPAPIQLYFCGKEEQKKNLDGTNSLFNVAAPSSASTDALALCKYPLRVPPRLLLCEGFERKHIFSRCDSRQRTCNGTQGDKGGLGGPFVLTGATLCPPTSFLEPSVSAELCVGSLSLYYTTVDRRPLFSSCFKCE